MRECDPFPALRPDRNHGSDLLELNYRITPDTLDPNTLSQDPLRVMVPRHGRT